MKQNHTCSKCNSQDIIRIPGQVGPYGVGNNILTGIFSAALVTRYLCAHCGYSEEWVEKPEDIAKIRKAFGKKSK